MNANKVNDNPSILEKTKNYCTVFRTDTSDFSDIMPHSIFKDMDKAIENFKDGYVSDKVDLSDFDDI